MTYEEKASEIIKESIKSAVFIDENARSFFQFKEELTGAVEEDMSIDLFNNFKESGISLTIHKYLIDDENNTELKNYLFEDRDLVLLDWNLNGQDGQEFSLELLADIVKRSHIHFCTVYTSERGSDLDSVFQNILSYFSNETKDTFTLLRESLELEAEIVKIKDKLDDININRDAVDIKDKLQALYKTNSKEINKIKELTGLKDNIKAIIHASIAMGDTLKSDIKHSCPSLTSFDHKTLIIDNTIITILNKKENDPKVLVENISKNITASKSSFTQLIGLEMQSIFSRSSAFIDENLLRFSKEALLQHRENFKAEDLTHFFPEFIKDILLEKAKLNIRAQTLTLLEESFLDSIYDGVEPDINELLAMNVFYNSSKLENDNKLNFGDVFQIEETDDFIICITALCDCLRPKSIDNKFFFARGSLINKEDALQLRDTAFISFLNEKQVVSWTDVTSMAENLHKFSPVYVKPIQFSVIDPNFDEQKNLNFAFLNELGKEDGFKAKYITTIKSNYTQRIANHAFSHPMRVGIDYVKFVPKTKNEKTVWQEKKDKYEQLGKEIGDMEPRLISSELISAKISVFNKESKLVPFEEKKKSQENLSTKE